MLIALSQVHIHPPTMLKTEYSKSLKMCTKIGTSGKNVFHNKEKPMTLTDTTYFFSCSIFFKRYCSQM